MYSTAGGLNCAYAGCGTRRGGFMPPHWDWKSCVCGALKSPLRLPNREGKRNMDSTHMLLLNLHLIESLIVRFVGLIAVALFGSTQNGS